MTLKQIKNKTDKYYGFDISDKSRTDEFKEPRQFYSAFCRMYNHRQHAIGKEIKRGHATIINAIKRFDENCFYKIYKDKYIKYVAYMLDVELFEPEVVEEVEENELILSIVDGLLKLNDSDILEFKETRLKPYLNALKHRKYQEVIERVVGASMKKNIKSPFLQ